MSDAAAQIWKFPLDGYYTELDMPKGARALSVQVQHGDVVLWAMVDPQADREVRQVHAVVTGSEFNPSGCEYVGTVQQDWFVTHIFLSSLTEQEEPHAG